MGNRRLAVLVDFDDTAAEQNVAELLLTAFCRGNWRSLRDEFRAGRISLREYQEQAFAQVPFSPETMARFVQEHVCLRPGFVELARYCHKWRIPIAIVTNGLEFYVKALLERYSLTPLVEVYAVQTHFTPQGPTYAYPWAAPYCWEWGNCKCRVLDHFRQKGYRIAYVGDSQASDLCPAARADLLFAHRSLLDYCLQSGIPAYALRDFTDVLETLKALSSQEAHRA